MKFKNKVTNHPSKLAVEKVPVPGFKIEFK